MHDAHRHEWFRLVVAAVAPVWSGSLALMICRGYYNVFGEELTAN